MEEFYTKLAEILEVDEVRREDVLLDFDEWDSLGVLSVISMIDESYGVIITNDEIKPLIGVGDLEDLITKKMES